jgi:hypothetical protein
MFSSPKKRPCADDPYRPRLAGEVVDSLHLPFEDDDEVAERVTRPEEDLSYLRCPRLPVALKDLELVFP